MTVIIFLIEDAPKGFFTARALGHSIFTAVETMNAVRQAVREAVACHFDEAATPRIIRLRYVRDEILAP